MAKTGVQSLKQVDDKYQLTSQAKALDEKYKVSEQATALTNKAAEKSQQLVDGMKAYDRTGLVEGAEGVAKSALGMAGALLGYATATVAKLAEPEEAEKKEGE